MTSEANTGAITDAGVSVGHVDRPGERDEAGLVRAESNPHRHPGVVREAGSFDTTWPVKGPEVIRLLLAAVAVIGTGILIGFTLTDWAAPNAITRLDERVTNWLVDNRTAQLDSLSTWAAFPADTIPKIIISALICGLFLWLWRRWDEAVYVALPLVFEATCFIIITRTVQRPRPPEEDQLIHSTINSSFPSGHVAAATVYAAVAIVVIRHTTALWARALAIGVFVVIAFGVYWARVYQGVHFLSDVVAGIVLGAVSVAITDWILRRRSAGRSTAAPAHGV